MKKHQVRRQRTWAERLRGPLRRAFVVGVSALSGNGHLAWGASQPAVVTGDNVNVRSRPSLDGEVLAQVNSGTVLSLLEKLSQPAPAPGQPTSWVRVQVPSTVPVWVYSAYVQTNTVHAEHLNLRSGPGETYSILGQLNSGDKITVHARRGNWLRIEAPIQAEAFVAANYLAPVPPPAAAAVVPEKVATESTLAGSSSSIAPTVQPASASPRPLTGPVASVDPVPPNPPAPAASAPGVRPEPPPAPRSDRDPQAGVVVNPIRADPVPNPTSVPPVATGPAVVPVTTPPAPAAPVVATEPVITAVPLIAKGPTLVAKEPVGSPEPAPVRRATNPPAGPVLTSVATQPAPAPPTAATGPVPTAALLAARTPAAPAGGSAGRTAPRPAVAGFGHYHPVVVEYRSIYPSTGAEAAPVAAPVAVAGPAVIPVTPRPAPVVRETVRPVVSVADQPPAPVLPLPGAVSVRQRPKGAAIAPVPMVSAGATQPERGDEGSFNPVRPPAPQPVYQLAKGPERAVPELVVVTPAPEIMAAPPAGTPAAPGVAATPVPEGGVPVASSPARSVPDPIFDDSGLWQARDETPKNEFSLGYFFTWGASARFGNPTGSLFPALPAGQYDNGYVRQSSRGNTDGNTWNWGYQSASQYDAANDRLLMSRSSVIPGAGFGSQSTSGSDMNQGVEFGYQRLLWEEPNQRVRIGLEASFSYASMEFRDARNQGADLVTSQDAYALSGIHLPPAPYHGTYFGPGPLLNNNPQALPPVTVLNGAVIASERTLDLDMFNLRLGPRVTVQLAPRLFGMASAGLAIVMAHGDFAYRDAVPQLNLSSSGHQEQFSLLPGAYIGLGLGYQLSRRWAVFYEVHFQYNEAYEQSINGRSVELNLNHGLFQTLGLSFSF